MSITSSIGLISGIDHGSIIDQLMALESRSQSLVKNQTALLQSQQVAFQSINAKLLSFKLSASALSKTATFNKTAVASSNEDIATATAAASAVPGSYSFSVAKLVTTQQAISKGVADKDAAIGTASTLSFEFGNARLDADTSLSLLNGGEGITRGKIRVTDRSGASAVVDLSKAITVDDVLDAINNTSGINITASAEGDGFVLKDNTGLTTTSLSVADVNTPGVAASLGLLGNAGANTTFTGTAVNTLGENTQLTSLNDGNGIRHANGQSDFTVTSSGGVTFDIDISSAKTVGDVMDLINNHANNTGQVITASLDGASLKITDGAGGGAGFSIAAQNGSLAAADLGILGNDSDGSGSIEGGRVFAALNSKMLKNLNGGNGALALGIIDINGTQVDLSGATSISDVLNSINAAGLPLTASLNDSGNGISLAGAASSTITVTDVTGNTAASLKLDQASVEGKINSGNLQFRYISESTQLATLNGGKGITKGNFTITDSDGNSATVDLSDGSEKTIQDVLSDINSRGLAILARINDNGDGITIEDLGLGAVALKVDEKGSTTARSLGILGEAANPGDNLVGTFEKSVEILATDTLTDIAKKINDANIGINASVFSDGSAASPYRLSLLSKQEGKAGSFVFDDGGIDLGINNLVEAQDAVIFFGSADPAKGIAIVSPSNTLNSLIPAVTINLKSVSDSPVSININRNDTAVTEAIQKFVDDFNGIIEVLNTYDKYDADTETKGLLLGDSTIANIRNSLYRQISTRNNDVPGIYKTLTQVGLKLANGAKLELDATKLAAAVANDRDAVIGLFSFHETETDEETNVISTTKGGFGIRMNELLERFTNVATGTLKNTMNGLDSRINSNNDRVENMQALLDAKRARLENQFAQMEIVLSQLQGQTSALNSLAQLASNYSTNRNS